MVAHNNTDTSLPSPPEECARPIPCTRHDAPDLLKYRADKAELSAIMRNFTSDKIHFVGIDNHTIVVPEYQTIRKEVKNGKDPAEFMKGEYRTYRTGYIKATDKYMENRLFFPFTLPLRTTAY